MTVALHPVLSEHILEIRFTPNARLLDNRGDWAEHLASVMELPAWEIQDNRLDVFREDKLQRAFVSHRNAGFVIQDAGNATLHSDRSQRFIRQIMKLPRFANPLQVERIGVRGRFCASFGGSFEQLRTRIVERYSSLTAAARAAFGPNHQLQDIGFVHEFTDPIGYARVQCGPMREVQLRQYFKDRAEIPRVGLYFDIDYSRKPGKALSADQLCDAVGAMGAGCWDRLQAVVALLVTS